MNPRHWIFLRGLGRNSGHWGDFLELFKQHFPNDKIDCLDLTGTGTENSRKSPLKIPDFVQDLRRRRNSTEPVSLLAISMGAMVASQWATEYPEEIKEMVLINTSSKDQSRFFERLRFQNYPTLLSMLLSFKNSRYFERKILELTAANITDVDLVLKRHLDLPKTSALNWILHLQAASGFRFPVQKPKSKVLFLAAKKDNLVSWQCSEKLSELWRAPLKVHPQGAHDLPLVDPQWIIDQIKESL